MVNQQLYNHIKDALEHGDISPRDLRQLIDDYSSSPKSHREKQYRITEIFSYIGGAIIFFGIVFFLSLEWDHLPSIARITVSLGGSVAAYIISVILLYSKQRTVSPSARTDRLPHALSLLAVVLMPVGLMVTLYEFGYDLGSSGVQSLVAGLATAFSVASFFLLHRMKIYLVGSFVVGTWLYYAFISFLTNGGNIAALSTSTFYIVVTVVLGVSYFMLARAVRSSGYRTFGAVIEVFGTIAILGAMLAGSGTGWDVIYPVVLGGSFAGSVYLANRGVLTFSSLFLIAYLIKITAVHFADVIGWPIALILIGALMIGVSYGSYRLSQRINQERTTL